MIVADFTRSAYGFKLRIEGHSGYSDGGEDIVCASVSGMFYALCGYLLNFKKGCFKVNEIQSGLAEIECDESCEPYLQLTCLGLWQVGCEYPENLKVNIDAWSWRMNPPCVRYGNKTH